MARWPPSRLRTFGIGAVAFLGGSLLVIPAVSRAEADATIAATNSHRQAGCRPGGLARLPSRGT